MSVTNGLNRESKSPYDHGLKAGVLLAVMYVISGKLGMMLALPPGYASPMFPPAGIAVAAVLIGGRKTLPWIFLGSIFLNVWIAYSSNQQINATALAVAGIIAFASLLQAAAGGWLLRKAIGYPTPLDNGVEVLRFLLLSPLICLISASISSGGLLGLGIFDAESFVTNWVAWWGGDTLGVLVMLPLIMAVAGSPRALWRDRISTVAVPMLAVFLFFVVMYLKVNQWEYSKSLADFRQYSQQTAIQLESKLKEQESLSEQLAALFIPSDEDGEVSRVKFRQFVQKMLTRFPMIQALIWVPKVRAEKRVMFELAQHDDLPGFEIRERSEKGQIQRASVRDSYRPVTYIEPMAGNEPAVGFDLASSSHRREAIDKAIQSGDFVASSPLKLVQDRQDQVGILLLMAITQQDPDSGIVSTVLHMGDFMEKLLPELKPMLFTRLIDLDAQMPLYDNFEPGFLEVFYKHSFNFGSRRYRLECSPTPAYFTQHRGWQRWWVLAISLLSTSLLGSLLLITTGYTARVERKVEARTSELKESEYRWKFALEGAGSGVWDWDVTNNTVFFSKRWKEILGFREGEIGDSLDEWDKRIHPDDKDETLMELQSYLTGETDAYVSEHRVICKDGSWKWILDRGMVVSRDADGKPVRLIGTHTDITERKQNEQLVQRLAHYDVLTGLPNRILFSDRLRQGLAIAEREQIQLSLMFIDLDKFKPVNDDYGHHIGDLLLKEVAGRMQNCLRKSDTVARIGGDEFVVLLPVITADNDAMLVAEKILDVLNQPFLLGEHSVNISSSIGIAISPKHGQDEILLMKNADVAMYHAKEAGRNNVKLYQHAMQEKSKGTA